MIPGALGCTALFTAITVTAYDGRAPLHPTAPMAALLVAGLLAPAAAGLLALRRPAGPPEPATPPARPVSAADRPGP